MRRILGFFVASILAAQTTSEFDAHLAAGKAALQRGRYTEAENELRRIADDEKLRSAEPVRFADALGTLSRLDAVIGRSAEAILLERRAVETMESAVRRS